MIIYKFSVKADFNTVQNALIDDKVRMKLQLSTCATSYKSYHMDIDSLYANQNPAMSIRLEKDLQDDFTSKRTIVKIAFYWTHAIFTSPTSLKQRPEVHERLCLIQKILKRMPEFEIEPEVV